MCERYVMPAQAVAEREFLPETVWWRFSPRFNVAAPQYVPAVRLHQGLSEGIMLRWGFIPSWHEGDPPPDSPPCAQADTLSGSTLYRLPWLASQRCILPASGFYIWKLTRAGYRQPFFVRLIGRGVFGLAALWDRWVSKDDDVIESCAVVAVAANGLVGGIGGARHGMPAILRRKDYRLWLQGTPADALAALKPYETRWMQAHPVSPRVNSRTMDDPGLIRAAV